MELLSRSPGSSELCYFLGSLPSLGTHEPNLKQCNYVIWRDYINIYAHTHNTRPYVHIYKNADFLDVRLNKNNARVTSQDVVKLFITFQGQTGHT